MSARKDPSRRQRGNSTSPDLRPVDDPIEEMPPPDPAWGECTCGEWETYWRSGVSSVCAETDMPTLRRLFSCRDLRAKAEAAYRAEPFVEGSVGQVRLNPMAQEMHHLDKEIDVLERQFGLGSHNRVSLGLSSMTAVRSIDQINAPRESYLPGKLGQLQRRWDIEDELRIRFGVEPGAQGD